MNVGIKLTTGEEVRLGYQTAPSEPVYYGGPPPDTGIWQVNLNWLHDSLVNQFAPLEFGESVTTFVIGFELADIGGWGKSFTEMTEYISYRPKSKTLVSVAQLDWLVVKDLDGRKQFEAMSDSIIAAVARVERMKRKPKSFDYCSFGSVLTTFLKDSINEKGWLTPQGS
jgi:hypothetical protein